MDGWDLALFSAAGVFAIVMLTRMMGEHRDATLERLRRDFQAEQVRLAAERRRQAKAERKRRLREEKEKYLKELEERHRRAKAA